MERSEADCECPLYNASNPADGVMVYKRRFFSAGSDPEPRLSSYLYTADWYDFAYTVEK